MQQDLFSSTTWQLIRVPLADADVRYQADFLSAEQAQQDYRTLVSELAWRQDSIRMFGKVVKIPRKQAWYGDPAARYTYSGLAMTPLAWTHTLLRLKQQVEAACQTRFNSVLANWYRDGQDSMGWHADDEPELGENPVIASLTLGHSRQFNFRHKKTKKTFKMNLPSGSLLVMAGNTQTYWQHSIHKQKQITAGRINLTFRYIQGS